MFTIEITDADDRIEGRIHKAMQDELNSAFRHAAPAIRADVADLAEKLILRTPEYESLVSGRLMGDFGLADPRSRLDAILAAIKEGVQVWPTPLKVTPRRIDGGLNIGILKSNYEDILDLSAASYVSEPSGSEIPWLGWLIGAGDRVIVFNYDVVPALTTAQRARSRSKKALMFKGSGWRVPPRFSGVFTDNFLTRAFNVAGVEAELDRIVEAQLMRRLR